MITAGPHFIDLEKTQHGRLICDDFYLLRFCSFVCSSSRVTAWEDLAGGSEIIASVTNCFGRFSRFAVVLSSDHVVLFTACDVFTDSDMRMVIRSTV